MSLDSAVALFGTALEAELNAVEGKNKQEIETRRRQVLDRWIPETRKAGEPKKFRDPRERLKR